MSLTCDAHTFVNAGCHTHSCFWNEWELITSTHEFSIESTLLSHTFESRECVGHAAHSQRADRTRIISARKAARKERKQYEEGIGREAK